MNIINFDEITPWEIGINHPQWRPNQQKALLELYKYLESSDEGPVFIQLPTGSGKSGIATALGAVDKVLVYVQSHALLDQYEKQYGFSIVKGLGSYPCVLPQKLEVFPKQTGRMPTAADCHFKRFEDCPSAAACPYFLAREKAFKSKRMACTYAYGMLSIKVRERSGIQVFDEAHLAASGALSLAESRITKTWLDRFSLPLFPTKKTNDVLEKNDKDKLLRWVESVQKILATPPKNLFFEEMAEWNAASSKMDAIKSQIESTDNYYVGIDPLGNEKTVYVGKVKKIRKEPLLVLKPLQAKALWKRLTGKRYKTVLMSATIGNPLPLATEFGVDQTYKFYDFPHPVPVEKRPTFDLGFEKMTWDTITKKGDSIFFLQAVKIAAWIRTMPDDWRGIIIVPSYYKRDKLHEALLKSSIKDRILPFQKEVNITQRISSFIENPQRGIIAVDISSGWGHGVDLSYDLARFSVVAGVPFGNFKDPYTAVRARVNQNAQTYAFWEAYSEVPQIAGRVTRGETDENGEFLYNASLLADGSASSYMARGYYPNWFSESIVKI